MAVKIVSLLRRNPSLSHQEFVEYWKDVHAPMCRALLPGLRRYVGSFPTGDSSGQKEPDIDGIIELGFDNVEALYAALSGPAFQTEERRASSDRVMDHERSEHIIVEDYEIAL